MPINSILIEGSSGTGKKTIARYLAYMQLQGNLCEETVESVKATMIKEDVKKEIDKADFTYIQAYPKLEYEDTDDVGYYTMRNLEKSQYLFSFKYKVSKKAIMEDDRFSMGTFGGEVAFSVK